MTKAIAIWSYAAQEDNEIGFKAGDIIDIVELCNQDWYEGTLNGETGLFPANHVKLIDPAETGTSSVEPEPAANKAANNNIESAKKEAIVTPITTKLSSSDLIAESQKGQELDESDDDSPWRIVTTEQGEVYYWNEETGETSWEPPELLNGHAKSPVNASSVSPISPVMLANPSIDIIKRQGYMAYKVKKEFGGVEPKKSHSWHSVWAIVCIGYILFYHDEPASLKKKSETKVSAEHVQVLENVVIKKDAKVGILSITSKSGAVLLLKLDTDAEVALWIASINESTKESASPSEYKQVRSRLLSIKNEGVFEKLKDTIPEKTKETTVQPKKKEALSDSSRSSFFSITPKEPLSEGEDAEDGSNKGKVKSKLNSFFKKVGEKRNEWMKEREKVEVMPVFGGSLEALAKKTGRNIPIIMERCVNHIEKNEGLTSQGIYRLSGNASTVQKYRNQINQDNFNEIFESATDLNVIAALLKLFLREIQIPIIPFTMYDRFIESMKIEDYNNRLISIKQLVKELPKVHYDVLEYLLKHLVQVASHSNVNKMEPSNIAIVFGPSIIRTPETPQSDMQAALANMMNMSFQNALVEAMVNQAKWLFED